MDDNKLLDATCRVAFSASHDLGKFAERARLRWTTTKREHHEQMYCPRREEGGRVWYTHKHAAYTALAWDLIEQAFPELVGEDVSPFAAWGERRCRRLHRQRRRPPPQARHLPAMDRRHRRSRSLRLRARGVRAATMRRDEETRTGRNHYTARQLTLFEHIRIGGGQRPTPATRWALSLSPSPPLAPTPSFRSRPRATRRQRRGIGPARVPRTLGRSSPRPSTPYPAATGRTGPCGWTTSTPPGPATPRPSPRRPPSTCARRSRSTTTPAPPRPWPPPSGAITMTAPTTPEAVRDRLRDYHRPDWDEEKLLLIQGDFFGIQEFIFATGGETQRRAAKLLRGRSFYVSLLTECAALRILDRSGSAAHQPGHQCGRANSSSSPPIRTPRGRPWRRSSRDFDRWFLAHTYGQSGIGIAWLPAALQRFPPRAGRAGSRPSARSIRRLFDQLQTAKTRRFDLCGGSPPSPVFSSFLDRFDTERGRLRRRRSLPGGRTACRRSTGRSRQRAGGRTRSRSAACSPTRSACSSPTNL